VFGSDWRVVVCKKKSVVCGKFKAKLGGTDMTLRLLAPL
jgi:hypothetical protein